MYLWLDHFIQPIVTIQSWKLERVVVGSQKRLGFDGWRSRALDVLHSLFSFLNTAAFLDKLNRVLIAF
jgi:hypothetical protein